MIQIQRESQNVRKLHLCTIPSVIFNDSFINLLQNSEKFPLIFSVCRESLVLPSSWTEAPERFFTTSGKEHLPRIATCHRDEELCRIHSKTKELFSFRCGESSSSFGDMIQ